MKKLLTIIMVIIAALCTASGLTACNPDSTDNGDNGGASGNEQHTHEYVWKATKPSQSEQGTATGTCTSCGDVQTVNLPAFTDSRYNKTQTEATCSQNGKVKYTITLNGATFTFFSETPATGLHNYVNGVCACGAVENATPPSDCDGPVTPPGGNDEPETPPASGSDEPETPPVSGGDEPETPPVSGGDEPETPPVSGGDEPETPPVSGGDEPETPPVSGGDEPETPPVSGGDEPADPDRIVSASIKHSNGFGKYLWTESDVINEDYNFYGARWCISYKSGAVRYMPLASDQLETDVSIKSGEQNLTVKYGDFTDTFTIYILFADSFIEADETLSELTGSDVGTAVCDYRNSSETDFGDLSIKGIFDVRLNGNDYYGYYGTVPVDERFIQGFDNRKLGLQNCQITAGNISEEPAVIGSLDIMVYDETDFKEEVFISDFSILKAAGDDGYGNKVYEIAYRVALSPDRPFIDVNKIPDRWEYYSSEYHPHFTFKTAVYKVYKGGGDTAKVVERVEDFYSYDPEYPNGGNIYSVLNSGEYSIKVRDFYTEYEVNYSVYDSDYSNIRLCRVDGAGLLNYELTGGVTVESVKRELLSLNLYVEYFDKVDGKYVHKIPIESYMLYGFEDVDETSFERQYCTIRYEREAIGVSFVKPYTVADAQVLYTLKNSVGVNFILSEATKNDLGKCLYDGCKEIVLYNNGCALLKHAGNEIGDVIVGYTLNGSKLTLNRHGETTAYLTADLANKTFAELDYESSMSGVGKRTYTFTHDYNLGGTIPIGWSGIFTAYSCDEGYVNVHLTGWASSANKDGYAYQIAGVEYVATWAYGNYDNEMRFVLRFADKDWWFSIGEQNDVGNYELTLMNI